jgi:hypothetical protein
MKIRVNLIEIDVEKIKPNPWNPNVQSAFTFEKELNSIKEHGFIDPITVRGKGPGYEVIDGEHRLKAAIQLGFTKIPCNNLGKVSDAIAKQLTLITNDTKGKNDHNKLAALLKGLSEEVGADELIKNLPYQENTIRDLLAQSSVDWNQIGPSLTAPPGPVAIIGEDVAPLPEDPKAPREASGKPKEKPSLMFISIEVPTELHSSFFEQIDRVNQIIDPGKPAESLSPVAAIQAIVELLRHGDLKALLGKDSKVILKKGKKDH